MEKSGYMRIRYTPHARADIEFIYSYLQEYSSSGAKNVMHAIRTSIEYIARMPLSSGTTNNPDVRVRTVLKYRYKIFYSIVGDAVEILHIRHTSRREWI